MQKQQLIIYQIISLIILKAYYFYFSYNEITMSAGGSGDGQMYIIVAALFIGLPAIITGATCIATTLLCTNKKAIIISYFFALFTPMSALWLLHSGWYHHHFYLEIDFILHVIAFIGYILFYNKLFSNSDLLITDGRYVYLKKALILSVLIIMSHVFYAQVIDACTAFFNIVNGNINFDISVVDKAKMQRHAWCLFCVLLNLLFVYKSWSKLSLGWYIFCMLPNIEFLCKCIFAIKSAESEYTSISYNITSVNLISNFITPLTNYLLLAVAACCITIFIYIVLQKYVNKHLTNFNILTLIIDTIYVLLSYFIVNTHFASDNILQMAIFITLIVLYFLSNKNSIVKTSVYAAILCICWSFTLIQKGNLAAQDCYFWAFGIPSAVGYYALDYYTQKGIAKKVGTTKHN